MADPKKAVAQNVEGKFFVDTTCINCDTCRQVAPKSFRDAGTYSSVFQQPSNSEEEQEAYEALLCCPTGSIGARGENKAKAFIDDFPMQVDEGIFYNGFNSEKSYGANSFLVQHPDGNWFIDSPKFLPRLVKKIEAMGGLKYIFLTHRDDVADAAKYAEHFQAQRIIHEWDADAEPASEIIIEGEEPSEFIPGFEIIPVPGHTRGHMVLLMQEKYLFSGDHLHYEPSTGHLAAYSSVCWYSWEEQTKSMARLSKYKFEWVLAGHGSRVHLPSTKMAEEMNLLVERMRQTKGRKR